jgi:hypothetical protein
MKRVSGALNYLKYQPGIVFGINALMELLNTRSGISPWIILVEKLLCTDLADGIIWTRPFLLDCF